jgi:hypothetical protein
MHFCSITLRSNQIHYFYYLKLKNYLQYIALIHYKLSLVFLKFCPTCFGASLAPSSGVSLNQISFSVGLLLGMLCSCCSVVLLLGMLCSCCSVVLFVSHYPTVVIHCWCPACVLSRVYPATICSVSKRYMVNSF